MMMLLSARTGLLESLLLDNGYLTSIRTAAAGAVAARWLARPNAGRVAIIGAGAQARLQLQALSLVRSIAAVTARAPAPGKTGRYAQSLADVHACPATACAKITTAMADVADPATPTTTKRPL